MKFLLDQSTDARLLYYLRQLGYDARRIASDYPSGLPDYEDQLGQFLVVTRDRVRVGRRRTP